MNFIYDPSLVLYLPLYELDGNSIMSRDACGHLSSVNGALWRPYGRYFDGTDDYIEATITELNFTSEDFSIEAWFKVAQVGADQVIFCRGEYQVGGYYFYVHSGNYLTFITNQAGSVQSSGSSAFVAVDTWYHTVVTRSGASVKIFVNGVEDTAAAGSHTDPVSSALTVKVGISWTNAWGDYKGNIGEIRIYNRVLTPQEIQQNYLATKWRYR